MKDLIILPKDIITNENISHGAKITYCYLLYMKQNNLKIKADKITKALNLKTRTYHLYIKELKANNLLSIERINKTKFIYTIKGAEKCEQLKARTPK